MKYTLHVEITNNKAGRFHYTVKDENGTIISERRSNRVYVACTAHGIYYFGRLDLVGKGDHARHCRYAVEAGRQPDPVAYMDAADLSKMELYFSNTQTK